MKPTRFDGVTVNATFGDRCDKCDRWMDEEISATYNGGVSLLCEPCVSSLAEAFGIFHENNPKDPAAELAKVKRNPVHDEEVCP